MKPIKVLPEEKPLSRQQRRRQGLEQARRDLSTLKRQHAEFFKQGVRTIPRPNDWRDLVAHRAEQRKAP